jgi:hypothetical protein
MRWKWRSKLRYSILKLAAAPRRRWLRAGVAVHNIRNHQLVGVIGRVSLDDSRVEPAVLFGEFFTAPMSCVRFR